MKTVSYLIILGLFSMPLAYGMNNAEIKSAAAAEQSYTICNPDTVHAGVRATINQYAHNSWHCHEAWLGHRQISTGMINSCTPLGATAVACLNFSPRKIKIFDTISGECTAQFPAENFLCTTPPLKLSDTTLAFGQADGTIAIWNFLTQQRIGTGTCPEHVASITYLIQLSKNFLISASKQAIIIWDITNNALPQATPLRLGLSSCYDSISRLSDTAFIVVEQKPARGQQTHIIQVWDLFDKKDATKFAPSSRQNLDINILEPTKITALTDTAIICENHPHGFKIIDLTTNKSRKSGIQHSTKDQAHLFKLSSNLLVSHTPQELSLWDYQADGKVKRIAQLSTKDQKKYHSYTNTTPLSNYSFACTSHDQMTIYEPNITTLNICNKMFFNSRIRLQALIHQLRRLKASSIEPLQLTTWGEKWFEAMPEAIQAQLKERFNIITRVNKF
jgi:hypothetical protein